ncbi:MAG: phospho-N-acetylmuramoyl-pentapeptide-transferase [Oscillospiraceae bacterium]|nr:phospho-N-acetylmuramoyl-pentapeptide-transferase [Oscillospiraceae bacterium]
MLTLIDSIHSELLVLITFVLSMVLMLVGIKGFSRFLPKDQGREFAVNGSLSVGKTRGVGIIMILALIVTCIICMPLSVEYIIYLAALFIEMLSGYLDDASEKPWGELKKGIIDMVVSVGVSVTVYYFHGGLIVLPVLGLSFTVPMVLYVILGTILIWASINVTNCADGVDGLCGMLSMVTLSSAAILLIASAHAGMQTMIIAMLGILFVYLWFNCSPSSVLMGDAGSRALGLLIAMAFMIAGVPVLWIPLALLLIIDGGLGLLKLTVLRVLKTKNFMKNIRTPIHDHCRKNKGWSDTQVVMRFTILQLVICAVALAICWIR